jgi:hypothetical protein
LCGCNICFNQIAIVSSKKSFVLRIDEDAYKALERWAADEFRSVNGQIEWLVQQKLVEVGRIKTTEENEVIKKKTK